MDFSAMTESMNAVIWFLQLCKGRRPDTARSSFHSFIQKVAKTHKFDEILDPGCHRFGEGGRYVETQTELVIQSRDKTLETKPVSQKV